MKTHHLILATLFLAILLTSKFETQAQVIVTLKIIPSNPTTEDTVKVICYSAFATTPGYLLSSTVNINETSIEVQAYYFIGGFDAVSYSLDTLTIGKLDTGIYELIYHIADTTSPTNYDTDTIVFTVQQPNGLQIIDYSDQRIKVYPNPFKTTATVFINDELLASPLEIRIYDIFGREIMQIYKERNKEIKIARDNLHNGIYLMKIISDKQIIYCKKIIVE